MSEMALVCAAGTLLWKFSALTRKGTWRPTWPGFLRITNRCISWRFLTASELLLPLSLES